MTPTSVTSSASRSRSCSTRSASSARLRALTSRFTARYPTTAPLSSRSGNQVISMSSGAPSARW